MARHVDSITAGAMNDSGNPDFPRGGLRGLLETLWHLHSHGETAVLGVVIATQGSTYQKPGAFVLLDADGLRHGVISGGCLEPALEAAAREVCTRGLATVIEFDTRNDDDLLFGSGIGCRGHLRIALLPLPPAAPLARMLFVALERGCALDLALTLDGVRCGAGTARLVDAQNDAAAGHWNADGNPGADAADATLHLRIAPPPRLLLLGAGPETPPLAAFARRMGWFIAVAEHRGRWTRFARAAHVDRLIEQAPAAAVGALSEECADALIAMSHNFAIDLAHLHFCARSPAGYIGLLGPAARREPAPVA